MSLEALFSKSNQNGIFHLNLHSYLSSLLISGSKGTDEEIQLNTKNDNSQNSESKNIELDYLKKLGIQIKGSDLSTTDKKLVISINVENDSPMYVDNLKKTLESLKASINNVLLEYKLSYSDILIIINFMKLKLNNFLHLFGDKNTYLITKEGNDKPFFYSQMKYFLDQEFRQEIFSYSSIEIVGVYQPGSTKYLIQKYLFLGILPHLKLNSVCLTDPIFLFNIESGVILEDRTIFLLFNSLVTTNNSSSSEIPNIEDNESFMDFTKATVFDTNKNLLSVGFQQNSTLASQRSLNTISNINTYEHILNSVYELPFRNVIGYFDIPQYMFSFKYSLKNYKLMIDYFVNKQSSAINYENNYYFHLHRFATYINNEMKSEIEFVQDASIGLYLPAVDYSSWTDYNTNIQATRWAKIFYFFSYINTCFSGKFHWKSLFYLYDIITILLDYFFLSIMCIVSYIIFSYCFESEYGAYTMLLYYPFFIAICIVTFYSGTISQLYPVIIMINIAFYVYYIFLVITSIVGIAHLFDSYEDDLNKAAFGILFAFNCIFYIIPFIIFFKTTLTCSSIIYGLKTLIALPNYTSVFLFGSFKNLFSKEFNSLHSLHLIIFLCLNFALTSVLYDISLDNGQKGILAIAIIFTILNGIRFCCIIINVIYNSYVRRASLISMPNKNAVIQFYEVIKLRKAMLEKDLKHENDKINKALENSQFDSKTSHLDSRVNLNGNVKSSELNNYTNKGMPKSSKRGTKVEYNDNTNKQENSHTEVEVLDNDPKSTLQRNFSNNTIQEEPRSSENRNSSVKVDIEKSKLPFRSSKHNLRSANSNKEIQKHNFETPTQSGFKKEQNTHQPKGKNQLIGENSDSHQNNNEYEYSERNSFQNYKNNEYHDTIPIKDEVILEDVNYDENDFQNK